MMRGKYKRTKRIKEKYRLKKLGQKNPMYGTVAWNKGKSLNEKIKGKMRLSHLGKPSPASGKSWTIKHAIKRFNQRGGKNHFWKGGKTKLILKIRKLPEYRFWRESIFKRDDYRCLFCLRKNKKGDKVILQVDHIKPSP